MGRQDVLCFGGCFNRPTNNSSSSCLQSGGSATPPEKRTRSAAGAAMAVTMPICSASCSSSGPWQEGWVARQRAVGGREHAPAVTCFQQTHVEGWVCRQGHNYRTTEQEAGPLQPQRPPAQCAARGKQPGRQACGGRPPASARCCPRRSRLQGRDPRAHGSNCECGTPMPGQPLHGADTMRPPSSAPAAAGLAAAACAGPTCHSCLQVRGAVCVPQPIQVRTIQQPCGHATSWRL